MASNDYQSTNTCWIGMVLVFLVSTTSSQNTTEMTSTMVTMSPSMTSSSASMFSHGTFGTPENSSLSIDEFTSVVSPTRSLRLQSEFSTMESTDLGPSKAVSSAMMMPSNTAQITPSETKTQENIVSTTPTFSEMTSLFIQPSTSSSRESNSESKISSGTLLKSSSIDLVSSDSDGEINSMAATSEVTPKMTTGVFLTTATMEQPNPSATTNFTFQVQSVFSSDYESTAANIFGDSTTPKVMATTVSEFTDLTTSMMTSEDTGYLSTKPSIMTSSTLQKSSSLDMISESMKTSSEMILSPSMTENLPSAIISPSVQDSPSVRGTVLANTIDTIAVTTMRATIQPSRTTEPTMFSSATVTSNDTTVTDRFMQEQARLQKRIDDLEDDVNGWKIAVAILASFLGLILLAIVIRFIIKCRHRDQPAIMTAGGVDDITRKEVVDMRKNQDKSFFKRPPSSNILNRFSSILFNKRASSSHELETFGAVHQQSEPSVMQEVNEIETGLPGENADVQMTKLKAKSDGGNVETKNMNGDSQEIRSSFTEVDLH